MKFTMGILMAFVFPLFVQVGLQDNTDNGYISTLCLMPTIILIAYVTVDVYKNAVEKKQKYIWLGFVLVVTILSGSYAYMKNYKEGLSDNQYYTYDEYVELAGFLPRDSGKLILPCDISVAAALRNIDGNYKVLYGEDMEMDTNSYSENVKEIYRDLQNDVIPVEDILQRAGKENVDYIILYKWIAYETERGSLLDEGKMTMMAETDNYWIFSLKSN